MPDLTREQRIAAARRMKWLCQTMASRAQQQANPRDHLDFGVTYVDEAAKIAKTLGYSIVPIRYETTKYGPDNPHPSPVPIPKHLGAGDTANFEWITCCNVCDPAGSGMMSSVTASFVPITANGQRSYFDPFKGMDNSELRDTAIRYLNHWQVEMDGLIETMPLTAIQATRPLAKSIENRQEDEQPKATTALAPSQEQLRIVSSNMRILLDYVTGVKSPWDREAEEATEKLHELVGGESWPWHGWPPQDSTQLQNALLCVKSLTATIKSGLLIPEAAWQPAMFALPIIDRFAASGPSGPPPWHQPPPPNTTDTMDTGKGPSIASLPSQSNSGPALSDIHRDIVEAITQNPTLKTIEEVAAATKIKYDPDSRFREQIATLKRFSVIDKVGGVYVVLKKS